MSVSIGQTRFSCIASTHALLTKISSFPPVALPTSALAREIDSGSVGSNRTSSMPILANDCIDSKDRDAAKTRRPIPLLNDTLLEANHICINEEQEDDTPLEWNSTARACPIPEEQLYIR